MQTLTFHRGTYQIDVAFVSSPLILPHIKAGKVKPLAVNAPARSPLLPEVPTLAEAGLPQFDRYTWFGMFAPAGTHNEDGRRKGRHGLNRSGSILLPLSGTGAGSSRYFECARHIHVARSTGAAVTSPITSSQALTISSELTVLS